MDGHKRPIVALTENPSVQLRLPAQTRKPGLATEVMCKAQRAAYPSGEVGRAGERHEAWTGGTQFPRGRDSTCFWQEADVWTVSVQPGAGSRDSEASQACCSLGKARPPSREV